MTLRPLLVTRVANTMPGVCVAVLGGATWLDPEIVQQHLIAVLAVLTGVVLAVRGYRLGIECTGEQATVHGYLRTRTVPRSSVIQVTSFPALRWRRPGGRIRWTPVLAFAEVGGVLPVVSRHNEQCTDRLRRWAQPPGRRR
ncbi:MAG TPA: hypothetical protein VFY84_05550 [Jiangellales bacterium]|nr:hypothetical protein [Jiangellales bacterium]